MPVSTITSEAILKMLRHGPMARSQLGCTRYRLLTLIDTKLVKRAGEAKHGNARKAVLYDLTAKGRKRAEKLVR